MLNMNPATVPFRNRTRKTDVFLFITAAMLATGLALFSGCSKKVASNTDTTDDTESGITGYPLVGTNQSAFFNATTEISAPAAGDDFYGQNANYPGTAPNYVNNSDGTVTDLVTGLMWQQTLDHNGDSTIDYADKLTYDEISAMVATAATGGHTDWRLPSIKEQYSLMMFSGRDISGYGEGSTDGLIPFINTDFFGFGYGDTEAGERLIDVQFASSTIAAGITAETMVFGVNMADGRIKGYGTLMMGQAKKFNYLLVRGNMAYGINGFTDNGDSTVTDAATGLMWMQDDAGQGMDWKTALAYAENSTAAGYGDWRLPDAKELQSIVDYSRSPQSTGSAAIDPVFNCTAVTNEAGETDYPYYWSSTTHANMMAGNEGGWGVYVAFGRAMGNMTTPMGPPPGDAGGVPPADDMNVPATDSTAGGWTDVHGAGAQRSDPKDGDPADYPAGNGPQGDAVRILNYVRLVRSL